MAWGYGYAPELVSEITQAAQGVGVDPALLAAMVWQESRGKLDALSHAGAIGLTQLMPATARELGVDPRDWKQNLAGGAMYLGRMLKQFGTPDKALAAYNAGPGRVSSLLRRHGDKWFDYLPDETKKHVPAVLGYLAKHGGAAAPAVSPIPQAPPVASATPKEEPQVVNRFQPPAVPSVPPMAGGGAAPGGYGYDPDWIYQSQGPMGTVAPEFDPDYVYQDQGPLGTVPPPPAWQGPPLPPGMDPMGAINKLQPPPIPQALLDWQQRYLYGNDATGGGRGADQLTLGGGPPAPMQGPPPPHEPVMRSNVKGKKKGMRGFYRGADWWGRLSGKMPDRDVNQKGERFDYRGERPGWDLAGRQQEAQGTGGYGLPARNAPAFVWELLRTLAAGRQGGAPPQQPQPPQPPVNLLQPPPPPPPPAAAAQYTGRRPWNPS